MRIAILSETWPAGTGAAGDGEPSVSARVAAQVARSAWLEAVPGAEVEALPVSDGGVRAADALEGPRKWLGGAEAVRVGESVVLAPAVGAGRWDVAGLAAALHGLAAEHASGASAATVVVPLGDEPPAGDAVDLWGAKVAAARSALGSLPLIALVGSDRPLLGLSGMAAATIEHRPRDQALALAAQAQEERWRELAREGDAAAAASLVGPARPSDVPGSGAAGGLAYCLAALGARLEPGAPRALELAGASAHVEGADLVVAVCANGAPAGIDRGVAGAAAGLAARGGLPCVVVAPEVGVGRRDLMAAGIAAAYSAGVGEAALTDQVRRVAQTWGRAQ